MYLDSTTTTQLELTMFIINMAIALIEHRADVEVIVDGHTALIGKTAALSLCLCVCHILIYGLSPRSFVIRISISACI